MAIDCGARNGPVGLSRRSNLGDAMPAGWYSIALVFLAFAAGYYLSYLFRTINAVIADRLASDLSLGAADLGLLTSAYFFTFAVAQLPLGVMLDRHGPRRVQGVTLLIAAGGATLFATSHSFAAIVTARALIGLGVASALMAGLKAIILWFPKERLALANGGFIMLGALGAVTATEPAEVLLSWTGWRGLFALLAVATAAVALIISFAVPEPLPPVSSPSGSATIGLKTVYTDPRFWRLAPLSAASIGTAWALQGLWAAPWLVDVEGLQHVVLVRHLFAMAVALCGGALVMGIATDRLRQWRVRPKTVLTFVATLFIAAQLIIILRLPVSSYAVWAVIAGTGSATVLSYAILAEYFPKEVAGRANAALNVLHIGAAFVIQSAIGLIVEQWTSIGAHYPAVAYQTAFALNLAVQGMTLAWFVSPHALFALNRQRLAGRAQRVRGP
jgi:MFS family permease